MLDYAQLLDAIRLPGGPLVGELERGSSFLTNLAAAWVQLTPRPVTHCWASPNDWLVSIESAHAGCDRPHTLPALDHRELVKPTSVKEDRYTIPMYEVRGYLDN